MLEESKRQPYHQEGEKRRIQGTAACKPGAVHPWEGDGWVEVACMDLQREPSLTNLRELGDVGAPSWTAAL